ncbi:MAG: biotin--[acetyl-CoA-carboxylase] ligase [Rothia sp. (in: high G+C Gram-positive bacteria)]|uniref:biotin--[acetyl-CoA-carboxylase] ligase n=1 Tax=Rothia sp. (in: high G+C Gram-positive bacteria) TaxID=1885016 RepID=UPI0026E0E0CD|nr:biotin--[acetyl-CoA-carboxylase] ligase [Rothia sp. (in: high G+C Gram-positive bacteria)]MDO5750342.1 biotin--[acetyl-CoA-carboxylase] ligase [Rothia sp. (in: high G+C Gram-positive bacteria)]
MLPASLSLTSAEPRVLENPLPGYTRLFYLPQVDSTNTYAAALLKDSAEELGQLSVCVSMDQRAGKGRLDRTWQAPAGTCLATTIIARPAQGEHPLVLEQYPWATLIAALAVHQTWILLRVKAGIKWPNDVMMSDKKGCGILAQLVHEDDGSYALCIGVGQNLLMTEDQLPVENATSVLIESGTAYEPERVLKIFLTIFENFWNAFVQQGLDAELSEEFGDYEGYTLRELITERMQTIGRRVRVILPEGERYGLAVGLGAGGQLLVEHDGGERVEYSAADVEHVRAVDGSYSS